ncbi:MAG: hypothetical protein IKR22_01260 [Clostridiales bacterium]|nr:hypothetical protein [Clostridiales bacterium]
MIDKAIRKITDEMMKLNDPLAQGIEEYLTGICTTDSVAARILDPGKSLQEIHGKIWDAARKRKKGNCAYIPPEEVYQMVRSYYGIDTESREQRPHRTVNVLDLL